MSNPLTSLITGLLLSAGLSLFFYFGILITYNHLPGSVLLSVCLIVIFSLLFWVNIKYDHMLDLNDVFSRTISFDMKTSAGFAGFFLRFMRPINPYIGAFITLTVILLLLWGVPALIIYLVIYPGPAGTLLKTGVFCLSAGICVLYFYSNKDAFPSAADKVSFGIGLLCGTAGVIGILSWI